ncbi:MAG: MerR family transcriptional regulator [Candidatus Babeliales bacterium]
MQQQKIHMDKRRFRIGDLAEELKVKKFVIRFWEKEFDIKSDRSEGGQRFYTSEDLQRFIRIKDLLYNKGFTIAGAKKQLYTDLQNVLEVMPESHAAATLIESVTCQPTEAPATSTEQQPSPTLVTPALYQQYPTDEFTQQLAELKEQLIQLKNKLKTS